MNVFPISIPVLRTYQDFHRACEEHGLSYAKNSLRTWVECGQPDTWGFGLSWRALCAVASLGVEGKPISDFTGCYLDTKYGSELYWFMAEGPGDNV